MSPHLKDVLVRISLLFCPAVLVNLQIFKLLAVFLYAKEIQILVLLANTSHSSQYFTTFVENAVEFYAPKHPRHLTCSQTADSKELYDRSTVKQLTKRLLIMLISLINFLRKPD